MLEGSHGALFLLQHVPFYASSAVDLLVEQNFGLVGFLSALPQKPLLASGTKDEPVAGSCVSVWIHM